MEVFERNINPNYSLNEFQNEEERTAVRKAKMESVKEFFRADVIKELGTGSSGRTSVYQVDNKAVKLICCVTKKCNTENMKDEMTKLDDMISKNIRIGSNIFREIYNGSKLRIFNDIPDINVNIIPFTGNSAHLPWKCDSHNRIGVDYAIEMPLAKCLTDELDTYRFQKQNISKEHPEDITKIITIGIDLCDALIVMHVMHKKKLIHQDIKPQNIFLYQGNYCLGDFGIAREEDSPQFFQEGTRNYWSPEQENGNAVDHRCDIYSLGLVLYELADIIPMSDHYEQRLHTEKKLPYLKTSVPEGLKRILQNACEYEPALRYQTAVEMKEDLCRLMEDTSYIPKATRDTNYFSRKTISPTGVTQMSSGLNHQSRNIIQSGPAAFHRQRQKNSFLQPETAWRAGKLWYEESRKAGSRFAGLDIDKIIMPLSSPSSHVMDFPIRVSENLEDAADQKPLSKILDDTENLRNMYLIGEGGIGKTTALNFVMEYTYKKKDIFPAAAKNVIPLFIELSKAPADYCNAYRSSHSTFIQRYLYILLGSVEKQCLLSENSKEMSQIMDKEDTSITDYIEQLLNTDEEHTKYLLLLDGLNEVSKKQLSTKEKDFLGTPSELIVDEIKELLEKHKNITAIITSRADETLSDMDDSFERYYLTGVSEEVIKKYLDNCKISSEQVSKNSRLMETLKIPLFLKLYTQLYNTADISTPGEILYAFFSERSTQYTARNRIAEIKQDHQKAGDAYGSNSLDEKMQWFILDFLLPELGWYMEKNDLYTVDLPTFRQVIDIVLKGENETDICGTYGRKYFKEYLKGEDPIPNTQTYAKHLLALEGPLGEDYASVIAKYCVYSLGILYVNNQSYSFIHQHIRDFFAAMKVITDMKIALYLSESELEQKVYLQCLVNVNENLLSPNIIRYIGEISKARERSSLIINIINLYRNYFPQTNDMVEYGVKNLLKIIYQSCYTLEEMDLSYLDLRNCYFDNVKLKNTDMTGCLINRNNLIPENYCGEIYKTAFSKSGKYVFIAGDNGTLSLWYRKTFSYIKTIKEYDDAIRNLSTSKNYISVSTYKETEILDLHTFKVVKRFKSYNAIFSPDGKYIVLVFRMKKARLYDTSTFKEIRVLNYALVPYVNNYLNGVEFVCFSSDSKHLAIATRGKKAISAIQIWDVIKKTSFQIVVGDDSLSNKIVSIDFANRRNLLAVITQADRIVKIFSISDNWDKALLLHSIDIKSEGAISSAKFVQNDSIIAVSSVNGQLFFLDYDRYDAKHELRIIKKNEHIYSISNTSKFENRSSSYLLTGSADHCAKLWDTQKLQCIGTFNKMSFQGIESAVFIKNGKYIVTNGRDNSILIWNSKSGKCMEIIDGLPLCTGRMSYCEEKQELAVSLVDGRVVIYNFNSEEDSLKIDYSFILQMQEESVFKLEYSLNGNYLMAVGYDSSYVSIYNFTRKTMVKLYGDKNRIQCATFYDSDGTTALVGTIVGGLKIYYSDTGEFVKEIYDFSLPYYESRIFQLLQHDDTWTNAAHIDFYNDLLYLNQNSSYLEVFNKNTGQCLAVLNRLGRGSYGTNIFVSKQGTYITSTTRTPNIKIYRSNEWKNVYKILGSWKTDDTGMIADIINKVYHLHYKKYNGHKSIITHVDFNAKESVIITASADGTVKIWELPNSETNESIVLTPVNTLKCIPGLKIQGLKLRKLHPKSSLENEDKSIFRTYGAITDEE